MTSPATATAADGDATWYWRPDPLRRFADVPLPGAWATRAACRGSDTDVFFDEEATRAKQICASCVVRVPCAQYAAAHPQLVGVWGGTTTAERAPRRRRRR